MRQQAIVISKDEREARIAKAQIGMGLNVDIVLCRSAGEAIKQARYRKAHAIFINSEDLLGQQRLAREYDGQVQTFSASFQANALTTKAARFNYRVSRWLQLMAEYWQRYGITRLHVMAFQLVVLGGLKALNCIKPVQIVQLLAHRVGHLAYNTYIYMLIREKGRRKPAVIALAPGAANRQLLKMWNRNWWLATTSERVCRWLNGPLLCRSGLWTTAEWFRDIDEPLWKHDTGKVFLEFTEKEEDRGLLLLSDMRQYGQPPINWHICFHSRDPKYLAQEHSYMSPERWAYHNFRDCNIKNYLKAAQWITEQGGYAIRMGAVVSRELPDTGNPMIVDYATKHRSDFGDIYLMSQAKFHLGAGCGLTQVATLFDVPIAVANYPLLEFTTTLRKGDIYIPKLLWWREKGRYLRFVEWLESGAGRLDRSEKFDAEGLEPRENAAIEILELCQEMYQKLEGLWEPQPGDEDLMRRYKAITGRPDFYSCGVEAEVATTFLRRHEELLF